MSHEEIISWLLYIGQKELTGKKRKFSEQSQSGATVCQGLKNFDGSKAHSISNFLLMFPQENLQTAPR